MIFAPDAPQVSAVLDWELSTLGDPVADFVYHLMMYRMPAGMFTGLHGLDFVELGIPFEQEYVETYCQRTGRDHLPNVDYLMVFVMFRLAAIMQGIAMRAVGDLYMTWRRRRICCRGHRRCVAPMSGYGPGNQP